MSFHKKPMEFYEELLKAGAHEQLAKAIVNGVEFSTRDGLKDLVTREEFHHEIKGLSVEIECVRVEMQKASEMFVKQTQAFVSEMIRSHDDYMNNMNKHLSITNEKISDKNYDINVKLNKVDSELKQEIKYLENKMESKIEILINKIDSKFHVIYIVGSIVSAILITPVLSEWFKPIVQRLLGN